MATGDQADVQSRLSALFPWSWIPRAAAPLFMAILAGIASALSFDYTLLAYIRLQTRIATATDGFLDLIAWDFFGPNLLRANGQSDASFLASIKSAMFRERNTRNAVVSILTELTGRAPVIFEPWRPADSGGYRTNGLFYGAIGGYGSKNPNLQQQAFVTAYRPQGSGIPNIAGYGDPEAGYTTGGQSMYASMSSITGITDADIYAAVDSVRPTCAILWVDIQS
jgi:hypothetical protein